MALGWKPIHFALAGMMLVFGSFNTLSVKWADTMTSESLDGTQKKFNHPFVQAIGKIYYWINTSVSKIDDFLQECSWERCSVCSPSGLPAGEPAVNRESRTLTRISLGRIFQLLCHDLLIPGLRPLQGWLLPAVTTLIARTEEGRR